MTGLLLDSTYLIAHDRARAHVRDVLERLDAQAPAEPIGVSAITVMELMHGVQRSNTSERRVRSQRFLDDILASISILDVTVAVAMRAGRIDALLTIQGSRIATADLLIAATAIEIGYEVVTANRRHFDRVPGLRLRTFPHLQGA